LKVGQARRLKDLERENQRLKKAVSVARPEHQPIVSQRHRLGILVASTVDDLEDTIRAG